MTDISQDRLACSMIVGEDVSLELLANKLRMVAAVGVDDGVAMIVHPSMLLPMARAFEVAIGTGVDCSNGSTQTTSCDTDQFEEPGFGRIDVDEYFEPVLGLITFLGIAVLAVLVGILVWVAL